MIHSASPEFLPDDDFVRYKTFSGLNHDHFDDNISDFQSAWDGEKYVAPNFSHLVDDATILSCIAARLAIEDAQLDRSQLEESTRNGVILGAACQASFLPKQQDVLSKTVDNEMIVFEDFDGALNSSAEQVAIQNRIRGLHYDVLNGASSGTVAIGRAYNSLLDQRVDRLLAGGGEGRLRADFLHPLKRRGIASFGERDSSPFDFGSMGAIPSSGSAMLMIESEESVNERKIMSYGEITGFSDLYTPEYDRISQDKLTAFYKTSMLNALESANMKPSDVGFIQANGIGVPKMDLAEANAISEIFDETIPVTSCGSIGYTLSASGALSIAHAALDMKRGEISPIGKGCFLFHQDRIGFVRDEPTPFSNKSCLINNFDFYGAASSMVLNGNA